MSESEHPMFGGIVKVSSVSNFLGKLSILVGIILSFKLVLGLSFTLILVGLVMTNVGDSSVRGE